MTDEKAAVPVKTDPRYKDIRFVTLAGSLVDLLLGVSKLVVGYAAQSQALIADGAGDN